MKKLFIILLGLLIITSCKRKNANVWTKQYEQNAYDSMYVSMKPYIKDDAERKAFAAWVIKKFKATLPGGMESISPDSLHILAVKVGREYPGNLAKAKTVLPWSTAEKSFKEGMEKEVSKTFPDKKVREKFCDCLVAQLKKTYPDSLVTPIPDSLVKNAASICKPM